VALTGASDASTTASVEGDVALKNLNFPDINKKELTFFVFSASAKVNESDEDCADACRLAKRCDHHWETEIAIVTKAVVLFGHS
jgi:hypothetical protein